MARPYEQKGSTVHQEITGYRNGTLDTGTKKPALHQTVPSHSFQQHEYKKISDTLPSEINTQLLDPQKFSKSYSDQTERFPVRSNQGAQYIMVIYETTSNHIFTETLKK